MAFERLSEQLAIVATIDPEAYTAAATVSTDTFDMDVHHEAMFVLMLGDIAVNTTVDFAVWSATASTTGTATTALANITQLTAGDDDRQVVVTVRGEDMADGYSWLRGVLTIGGTGGTVDLGVVALADRARFKPASVNDLASVDEIVNA